MALAVFSGDGAASRLFVLGGGITLWLTHVVLVSSLFFVSDAIAVLTGQPLWPSLMQSLILARATDFRAFRLQRSLINLISAGVRRGVGPAGADPAGRDSRDHRQRVIW